MHFWLFPKTLFLISTLNWLWAYWCELLQFKGVGIVDAFKAFHFWMHQKILFRNSSEKIPKFLKSAWNQNSVYLVWLWMIHQCTLVWYKILSCNKKKDSMPSPPTTCHIETIFMMQINFRSIKPHPAFKFSTNFTQEHIRLQKQKGLHFMLTLANDLAAKGCSLQYEWKTSLSSPCMH